MFTWEVVVIELFQLHNGAGDYFGERKRGEKKEPSDRTQWQIVSFLNDASALKSPSTGGAMMWEGSRDRRQE